MTTEHSEGIWLDAQLVSPFLGKRGSATWKLTNTERFTSVYSASSASIFTADVNNAFLLNNEGKTDDSQTLTGEWHTSKKSTLE